MSVAQGAPNPWATIKKPAAGAAAVIGSYNAGCVKGAKALPAKGIGYEVMRPKRRRYFGHPSLIGYVKDIGKRIKDQKAGPLLVADLGQPMGGPAPSGHSSHQSGLDVDIWLWHPEYASQRRLRRKERQNLKALSVVDLKAKELNGNWSEDMRELLRTAASDKRVARIFINPVIKKHLCELPDEDRSYLRKLRPWYGHHEHFHVRLKCPKGSVDCEGQNEVPEGDGCEGLDWWLDDEAQAARKKSRKKYQSTVGATPKLPKKCDDMIAPDEGDTL